MKRVASALAFVSLACALLAAEPHAQPNPPTSRGPVFSIRADLVSIDVSVSDSSGRPVAGLRRQDFTVLVDGQPRRVVAAVFEGASAIAPGKTAGAGADRSPVDASPGRRAPRTPPDTAEDAAPDAPRHSIGDESLEPGGAVSSGTGRRFIIVVDRQQILAGEGQQALAAAARFVQALPASDRVAVWNLPARSGRLDFDQSREVLARRIRDAAGTYRPVGQPGVGFANLNLQESHQRADSTIRQLRDLVSAMAEVEGPKHVVLVTGGGLMDATNAGAIRELGAFAASCRTQFHAVHVRPPSDLQVERSGFRCECQDENVLANGAMAYELALLTGGSADRPTRALIEGASADRLARELSAWYVLGVEPLAPDRDGRPHRIEVRVPGRPDAGIRARRTFHIESRVDAPATTAQAIQLPARPADALPPPALFWDGRAVERAQDGAPPFMFIPEWLEAAERLCAKPELGEVAREIAAWEPERLESMLSWLEWIQARAARPGRNWFIPNPARLALLHTAAALSQVADGVGSPQFRHLEVAEALLSPQMGPASVAPDLRRQWFEVTPQWMLAYDRQDYAIRRTQHALREYPDYVPLLLFAGVVEELTTSSLLDPMRFNTDEWRRRENEVATALRRAERAYRNVLQVDPGHAEAHVRLGRVLDRQGERDAARAALAAALDAKPDAEIAWLAHMLLGRVLLENGQVEAAVAQFEAAVAILPSQSASIALAHALVRNGQREAARARLSVLTPPAGVTPPRCEHGCDPWQRYDIVDVEGISALVSAFAARACGAQ